MDEIYFLIPNWKWVASSLGFTAGLLILNISKPLLSRLIKSIQSRQKLPKFLFYFFAQDLQYPAAWLLAAGTWNLVIYF